MNEQKQLERLALKAHANGLDFSTWWPIVKPQVDALEPWCLQRWRKLRNRLMHLVCTGDGSGQFAVGDSDAMPWDVDDRAENSPPTLHQTMLFPTTPQYQ